MLLVYRRRDSLCVFGVFCFMMCNWQRFPVESYFAKVRDRLVMTQENTENCLLVSDSFRCSLSFTSVRLAAFHLVLNLTAFVQ